MYSQLNLHQKVFDLLSCQVLLKLSKTHYKINNSEEKHKGNHSRERVFICDNITDSRFSQNFCLDFLALDNINIEKSFLSKLTRCV